MGITARISDCVGGHISLTHYTPGEVCHAHRHAGAQISLLLSGDYREDGSAGHVVANDGVLTGKPAGFEHENTFGDFGALILSVNLYEAPFLKTYVAGRWPAGVRDALLTTAAVGELDRLVPAVCDGLTPVDRAPGRAEWLEQAHASLSTQGDSRTGSLAQTAGLHPVTFSRLFRDAFGRSPAAVRKSCRAARALQAIIRSRAGLIDIALDAGFADQAHMTRAVRQITGYPPARLRRMFATA